MICENEEIKSSATGLEAQYSKLPLQLADYSLQNHFQRGVIIKRSAARDTVMANYIIVQRQHTTMNASNLIPILIMLPKQGF